MIHEPHVDSVLDLNGRCRPLHPNNGPDSQKEPDAYSSAHHTIVFMHKGEVDGLRCSRTVQSV